MGLHHHSNSLFILYNDRHVKMPLSKIFDSSRFSVLRCVTYSSSGPFISKYLHNFKKIYIIQGIHESQQLSDTYEHLNGIQQNAIDAITEGMLDPRHNLANLYRRLSTPIRKMMVRKDFDLRVPITKLIHSKFYLLSNPKTKETRVIRGSANLSSQAFNSHSNQIEDIYIDDNEANLFKVMSDHFNQLYQLTSSYITSTLRRIASKQLKQDKKYKNKGSNQKDSLTKKQSEQIRKSVAIQVKHNIQKKLVSGQASSRLTLNTLRHAADRNPRVKRQITKWMIEHTAAASLIHSTLINNRTKIPKFKSDSDINKGIVGHLKKYKIHIYHFDNKSRHATFTVPMVLDHPETRQVDKSSGLSIQDHGVVTDLGSYASKDEIKKSLLLIDAFFKGIKKYGYGIDDEYLSRGMEAILYGFTASFLGDIRNQVPASLVRGIHMFMFIGGQAHSGKTTLLKFIMKMLGYYLSTNAIRYDDIVPAGHNKKSDTINVIRGWMESQYVTPIPVNEITPEFFNKSQYGESLVLNVTGDFQEHPDQQFSSLMGVTNVSNYNLSKRARTRCYYLDFGRHLNTSSSSHVDDWINIANDDLVNDFDMRISNFLAKGVVHSTYNKAMIHHQFDFLYWTRKIFKDYYKLVGLPIPKYFPNHLYNDSQIIGARRWRNLFINNYRDFKITNHGKNITYNVRQLDKHSYNHNTSRAYANALPAPSVLPGSATDAVLEMRRKPFFTWIHVNENEFRKERHDDIIKVKEQTIHDNMIAKLHVNNERLAYQKRQKTLRKLHKKQQSFWYKLIHHGKR